MSDSESDSRSRSRSPLRSNTHSFKNDPYVIKEGSLSSDRLSSKRTASPETSYKLIMNNIPYSWGYERIKQFIKDNTNSSVIISALKFVTVLKDENQKPKGACLLKFNNSLACKLAMMQLKGLSCEGKKIYVTLEKGNQASSMSRSNEDKNIQHKSNRYLTPKNNSTLMSREDNYEMYGLSIHFLNSHKIKLPLLTKIFIANLDEKVDEAKLKEVFSLAGQVTDVVMLKRGDGNVRGMAKVEFDHPVEAVQAITMFHNQELFDLKLVVHMDNSPQLYSKTLPKGLKALGPGLGPNGEPLKGVRNVVELQPIKQLLIQECTKMKNLNSTNPIEQNTMTNLNQPVQIDTNMGLLNNSVLNNPLTSMNMNTLNPFNQTSLMGLNPLYNAQIAQNMPVMGLMSQSMGNDLRAYGLQAQNIAKTISNVAQMSNVGQSNEWKLQGNSSKSDYSTESNYGYERQQSSYDNRMNYKDTYNNGKDVDDRILFQKNDEDDRNVSSSDMLIFNNLPSSVTLQALNNKMREVGELKFAEITGHGRAIVRFASVQDAERCIKLFDHSKVDGQTIEVRFL